MKTETNITGVIHIGKWRIVVEGDYDEKNGDVKIYATMDSVEESEDAWRTISLLFKRLSEIANSEVKERYNVEVIE